MCGRFPRNGNTKQHFAYSLLGIFQFILKQCAINNESTFSVKQKYLCRVYNRFLVKHPCFNRDVNLFGQFRSQQF